MAEDLASESQETRRDDSSFVWDQASQLYFHASSGFYHDPNAGWYYSSRDGLYYKFDNGSYVLLESNNKADNECEIESSVRNLVEDESCAHFERNDHDENFSLLLPINHSDACQHSGINTDESTPGYTECSSIQEHENLRPPSEWLEETLINLYLPGANRAIDASDGPAVSLEMGSEKASFKSNNNNYRPGEGDQIAEADASRDEENWRAQYGQVVHSKEEPVPNFPVVDLWDWEMVKGRRKIGKDEEARLVGRLVKRSAKLHPSMPSNSHLFRTAPICKVHFDLVQVRSGQVYKLHSPSTRYLSSLSTYDSSNPTKEWGFPELSITPQIAPITKSSGKDEPRLADGDADGKCMAVLSDQVFTSVTQRSHEYRDRAAQRRSLHGGFGVGPGQKITSVGDDDAGGSLSPSIISGEETAAEALSISFGAGSYPRKILESMGWKEGEGLGNTIKGVVEPVEAVGNMGNAGLGWPHPQGRRKHS